jgi:hypothetical protein
MSDRSARIVVYALIMLFGTVIGYVSLQVARMCGEY